MFSLSSASLDLKVPNSEFTQQKRTAKRLSVTNVTGLLLACFVANSLKIDVSFSSTKRSVQRNVKFDGSKAKAKLLSRLSHKVCRRLSSPVLLHKFTIIGHKGRTSVLLCRKCIKYAFLLYPYPVTDCLYLEENKAISVAILKSWT